MDFLAVRGKGINPSGYPVVKTGAQADDEVGLVHRHIGFKRAVHAQHAQPFVGRRGKGSEAHQGGRDGASHQFGQFPQGFACLWSAVDDPATGIKNRCLCVHDHFGGRIDRLEVAFCLGLIAGIGSGCIGAKLCRSNLDILRNIDDHRTRAALGGDMKGFLNDLRQIGRFFHQIIMFGTMARDTDRVGFLKGIGADQIGCNLAGDDDHRNAVHKGIGNTGNGIGRTRAGCYQYDTGLAGRTGIAFRRMGRCLLVADQYMLDFRMFVKRIINGQDGTARIAENGIHTQVQQGFDQYIGAAFFGHIMLH